MKAALAHAGQVEIQETAKPSPKADEVLIRNHAAGINRADLAQMAGRYLPPPGASQVLGLECSGIIEEVGSNLSGDLIGRQVCALLAGGGLAEFTAVPLEHTLPVPQGLDLKQAAALTETFATAWLNLKLEGRLQPNDKVLVHAGASGVGVSVIQLCQQWGNPVFVTVGSQDKLDRCLQLGAQAGALRSEDWAGAVEEWGKADVILDPVGGNYLSDNIHSLRPLGRLVCIGILGGPEGTLPIGRVLVNRLQVVGSVLRSRSKAEKSLIVQALQQEVWPLLSTGKIAPIIHSCFPFHEINKAYQLMASNQNFGKILITFS